MARPQRGFTLIELLVAISIIALLIGILLPALGRARNAADKVLCLSNLRQQATAITMYANDFRERLPAARTVQVEAQGSPLEQNDYLQDVLIPYIDGERGDGEFSEVLRCPSIQRGRGKADEIDPSFDIDPFSDDPFEQFWLRRKQQMQYRYNWPVIVQFRRDPADQSQFLASAKRISDAVNSSTATLTYDMAFGDWLPEDFPHGEASSGLNVSFMDGHAAPEDVETYLEQSENPFNEQINTFNNRGWE